MTNKAAAMTRSEHLSARGLDGLRAMLKARDVAAADTTLRFRCSGCRTGNVVVITLTADDLYQVDLYKVGSGQSAESASQSGVFAAELQETFTALTGPDTGL